MSIFNKIKVRKPRRTMHDLSYPMTLSLGYGDLVPLMCEKVVPGDKFIHGHEFLLRMSPFVSQVYQSFAVKTEYFFVPSRILWENFEKFLVEDDNTLYPHPQIPLVNMYDGQQTMENTMVDYIEKCAGIPSYDQDGVFKLLPIDGNNIRNPVDALPYAAMCKIFMDYYVDENLFSYGGADYNALVEAFDFLKTQNGTNYCTELIAILKMIHGLSPLNSNPRELFQFFKRCYPKDYFTSALPWAQRGPIVQIPLNGSGDVNVYGPNETHMNYQGVAARYNSDGTVTLFPDGTLVSSVNSSSQPSIYDPSTSVSGHQVFSSTAGGSNETTHQAAASVINKANNIPLSFKAVNVNGTATITDLRTAMTVQAWLEKNARAGVRYKEQLASHFGVRSRDYRLDRAELLQSTSNVIHIGELFTTAQNENNTFLPGLGISTGTGTGAAKPFKHYFEEHGYVIGFMSVFPRAKYSQGIPRQRFELDKFDYYWPEFQHIGEQEVYNIELFVDDNQPERNFKPHGYQPRYAHYKSRYGENHGDMVNTLHFMTAGRQFTSAPALNQSFVKIDPDKNHLYRTFNAVATPYSNALPVQVDFFHNFKALRPMDYFGSPRII